MSIYSQSFKRSIINNTNTSLGKIFGLINSNPKKILDVGCSTGYFGEVLKKTFEAKVDGIEINKSDYLKATKVLDEVYNLNIDIPGWTKNVNEKNYETIIFADVLEHTSNPKKILEETKQILSKNGEVLISVPNVTHQSVIIELICGQWNYTNSGILDKTHLRFFDQNGIIDLIEKAGLYIKEIDGVISILPDEFISKLLKKNGLKLTPEIAKIIHKNSANIFQHIIKASVTKPADYKSFQNKEVIISPVYDWIDNYKIQQDLFNSQQKQLEELINNKRHVLLLTRELFILLKNEIIKKIYSSQSNTK